MHQDDPEARAAETEYYFGPDLLVAPVLEPGHAASRVFAGRRLDRLLVGQAASRTADHGGAMRRSTAFRCMCARARFCPKIPDDVMTLVPATEFANRA